MNKKKLLALLMALVMTFSLVPVTALAESTDDFYVDNGVYHIKNLAGLKAFRNSVNAGKSYAGEAVQLDANIDLTDDNDEYWEPIGKGYYKSGMGWGNDLKEGSTPFSGTFDGQNHTISNLRASTSDNGAVHGWAAGLFGIVNGGTIQNLTIENATVNSDSRFAGAVAGGVVSGTIDHCTVSGEIHISGRHFVGGIVGMSYGTIQNCSVTATGTISADDTRNLDNEADRDGDDVGGIVGYISSTGRVTNCSVDSSALKVSGLRQYGSIVGFIDKGVVEDSTSNALAVRKDTVAIIGTTEYATLQAAFNAVQNNDTITLLDNVTEAVVNNNSNNFSIDLNGFTWTSNGDVLTTTAGTITILATNGGAMTTEASKCCAVWAKGGSVVINGGTFTTKDTEEATIYVSEESSTVTINGGAFQNTAEGQYTYGSSLKPLTLNVRNSLTVDKITVNGGTFYGNNPADGDDNMHGTFLSDNAAAYYDVTNSAWVVTTPILAAKAVAARFVSEVYNHCGSNVADVETPADYFISLSSKPTYVGETATEIDLSVGKNSHIKENDFAANGMKVAWPVVLFSAIGNDPAQITSTKVNGTTYTTLTDNGNNDYTVVQDYDHYENPYIGFGIEGTSSTDKLVTRKVNTYNQTVSTSYGVSTPDAPSTTGGSNYGIWTYWPGYNKTIQQVREMDGQTLDYSIYNTTTGKTAVVHLTLDCKPVPTPVAQIGTTEYASLAEAVESAQSGATITLLSNITLTETVNITKDLTIDLNGHSITATDVRALNVKSGNVTITGTGTISANGEKLGASSSVIRVGDSVANTNAASLTVGENVTIESAKCYGITAFGYNNTDDDKTTAEITLTVNGKVIVTGNQAAISGNGTNELCATTMTIGANAEVRATGDYAIYHPGKGTLTVNGTVSGKGGIEAKSGTVIINNGATVEATAQAQTHTANNNGTSTSGYAIAAVENGGYQGDASVEINGGFITGPIVVEKDSDASWKPSISISGGLFTIEPNSGLIKDGYQVIAADQDPYKYQVGKETATIAVTTDYETENITPVVVTNSDDTKTLVVKPVANLKEITGTTTEIELNNLAIAAENAIPNANSKEVKIITGLSATQAVNGDKAPQTVITDQGKVIFAAKANGGQLRLDKKFTDGTHSTYNAKYGTNGVTKAQAIDYVDLRLQFQFTLPEGVSPSDNDTQWYWTVKYNGIEKTVNGVKFLRVSGDTGYDSKDAVDNTYTSNVVVTNIPVSSYGDLDFSATLTISYVYGGVTYTISQSSEVPLTRDISELANHYATSQDATISDYANEIKQYINSANQ